MPKQRSKKAIVGSISIFVARFCSLSIGWVLTGMIARYLSPEEFGLWSIIIFLSSLVPTFDIGIGLALRNKLAALFSKKQHSDEKSKVYFFSVFYFYIGLALFISIILLFIKPLIPWGSLFNTTNQDIIREGALSLTLGLILSTLGLPFSISTVGFFSYQETQWNSFFDFLKSFFTISFVSLVIIMRSSFTLIVIIFLLAMQLPLIISFYGFIKKRGWPLLLLSFKTLSAKVRELIPMATQFGIMQISATLMVSTQALIAGKVAGLKEAGEYALVQRLFLFLNLLHFAVLTPLWSAYTEAIASEDVSWMRRVLRNSVLFSVFLFALGSLAFYFLGKPIIFLWTEKTITNPSLFAFMGLWMFITGWVNCFSVFLNGVGKLKIQAMLLLTGAIIYIPLSMQLAAKMGVVGICLAGTLAQLPLAISNPIQSFIFMKNINSTNHPIPMINN